MRVIFSADGGFGQAGGFIEVADNVGARSRGRTVFAYDHMSRRASKKVYSWDGSAWALAKTEKFAWDGWQLVAVFNAANEFQRSFCWGEYGELTSDTDHVNSKAYLPIYDGNKNIHGYVDAADGSLVSEYDFDPFGRIIAQSGTGDFPFRFASYFYDEETGMIYYGHRYYTPDTGRFISQDPIEETGGINLYCMAGNNIINLVDLLGLWTDPQRDPENPRAILCATKDDDSIAELGKTLGFDGTPEAAFGANGWLRDKDGMPLPNGTKIINKASYSVPNVVIISRGSDFSFAVGTVAGIVSDAINGMDLAFREKNNSHLAAMGIPGGATGTGGYKVALVNGGGIASFADINANLSSENVAGWAHAGHGEVWYVGKRRI